MPLSASEIARHLDGVDLDVKERFLLAPHPDSKEIRELGAASIDLRLGTWFVTTKVSRHALLDIYDQNKPQPSEHSITRKQYVPLGRDFILHPNSFVLAGTLEWLRMPKGLSGYVTGKSSWGRRGLIIETAPGVHPGYAGCLTLELANVGEIPIRLVTGTKICQLFLHKLLGDSPTVDQTTFLGQRQPRLGSINPDAFVRKLMAIHRDPADPQKKKS